MKTGDGYFEGVDGLRLFYRAWLPEDEQKAVVILAHGFAEHSGRYDHVGRYLAGRGYAVYAPDHRGHGRSEGERAYVERFSLFVEDLHKFRNDVVRPESAPFLIGHSMGGLIAVRYALSYQDGLAGLITSGAGLKIGGDLSPLLIALSRLIAVIAPKLPVVEPVPSDTLSHDPSVAAAYDSDPLNYRGKVKARIGAEMMRAGREALERAHELRLPMLIMHGGADSLVDPDGSRELYQKASSDDKTLKIYDGMYHEIFNEVEKEKVLAEMAAWLDAHL